MSIETFSKLAANSADDVARLATAEIRKHNKAGATGQQTDDAPTRLATPATGAIMNQMQGASQHLPNVARAGANQMQTELRPKPDTENTDGTPTQNTTLDKVEQYMNYAGMAGMIVPFALPYGGKAFGWLGNNTGIGMFSKLGNGMNELAGATFGGLGRVTGLGGVGGAIASGAGKIAGAGASVLQATGVPGAAANHYGNQFARNAQKMEEAAANVMAHARGSNNPVFGQIHSLISSGPAHAIDYTQLTKALEDATNVAGNTGSRELRGAMKKLTKAANGAETSLFFHHGYKNLSQSAKNLAANAGKANIWHGVMNATFVAGAGISDYRTTVDLHKALKDLKHMHCAVSGEKEEDVTAMGLMFGKVSEPVAAARAELMKEFGPAVVLDAANTLINIKFAVNSKFGTMKNIMLLMALPMASTMIAHGLLGSNVIPAYNAIKEAECKGKPVTNEMVERYIGNASRTLHGLGGVQSNFTKAVADFYVIHHAKADTLLKEIADGTLDKRVATIKKEYDDYMRAHPEVVAAQQARNAQAAHHPADDKVGKFVDDIKDGAKNLSRSVIGPETQKLQTRTMSPQPQQPGLQTP